MSGVQMSGVQNPDVVGPDVGVQMSGVQMSGVQMSDSSRDAKSRLLNGHMSAEQRDTVPTNHFKVFRIVELCQTQHGSKALNALLFEL